MTQAVPWEAPHSPPTKRGYALGVALAALLAGLAAALSAWFGVPAMLAALVLGIAFNRAVPDVAAPGVAFCAQTVLRLGIVLLGARMSEAVLAAVGWPSAALVVGAMALTVLGGLGLARLLGQSSALGVLTGCAVAVCGASAALAVSAALPRREDGQRDLVTTVLGVTVLSTLAMLAYPALVRVLGLDAAAAGVFLGGTIHDVAQVVGAGFSVSPEAGDAAVAVKLMRVAMLAPVVFLVGLASRPRAKDGERPPLLPGFVLGFLALAVATSFGLVPDVVTAGLNKASGVMLLAAIAAVGLQTSWSVVRAVPRRAMLLLVAETALIGGAVLWGLRFV